MILDMGCHCFGINKLSFITTMANIFLPQLFIIVHKLQCLSNTMFIKISNYGTTATKLFWYDHQSSSMFWEIGQGPHTMMTLPSTI